MVARSYYAFKHFPKKELTQFVVFGKIERNSTLLLIVLNGKIYLIFVHNNTTKNSFFIVLL